MKKYFPWIPIIGILLTVITDPIETGIMGVSNSVWSKGMFSAILRGVYLSILVAYFIF